MAVVALVAVGSSFMFVTRIYSFKDAYEAINVADASTVDDTSSIPTKNIEAKLEKKEEVKKAERKSKEKKKKKKKEKKSDIDDDVKSNSVLGNILVPMDSIVVNLGNVDSRRYLRVIISLEVSNSETEMAIKENKVIFRDKLVSYFSTKDAKEIGTQDNQFKLRSEIKDNLNKLLGSDNAITQVYFSDFIVQ